jgi:hypothetical protein
MGGTSRYGCAVTVDVVSVQDIVRGRYVDAAGRLALHESGHCAIACFVGLHVESATIARAHPDRPGLVRLADADPCLGRLLAVLGGPETDGEPITWPPLNTDDGGDEALAALLVAHLELDLDGWSEAVDLVRQMLELRSVRRARSAIAAALYESGTLDGAEVHRIAAEAFAGSRVSEQVEEDGA